MSELRYTLLADGSSDRALLPMLTWALRQQGVHMPSRQRGPIWGAYDGVHAPSLSALLRR